MLKETSFRDEDKTAQKKSSVHYALEPTLRLQLHRRSSANIFEFTFFDKDFAVLPTQDIILDLVRGPHLLGVIIAMGAAIYYDLRSLHRIFQPLSATDIEEVRRIHIIVATGFTAIWMTGLGLLWIRTGFDVASFSPKLWCKTDYCHTAFGQCHCARVLAFADVANQHRHAIAGPTQPCDFDDVHGCGCFHFKLAFGADAWVQHHA